jgi:hypothetical protein
MSRADANDQARISDENHRRWWASFSDDGPGAVDHILLGHLNGLDRPVAAVPAYEPRIQSRQQLATIRDSVSKEKLSARLVDVRCPPSGPARESHLLAVIDDRTDGPTLTRRDGKAGPLDAIETERLALRCGCGIFEVSTVRLRSAASNAVSDRQSRKYRTHHLDQASRTGPGWGLGFS